MAEAPHPLKEKLEEFKKEVRSLCISAASNFLSVDDLIDDFRGLLKVDIHTRLKELGYCQNPQCRLVRGCLIKFLEEVDQEVVSLFQDDNGFVRMQAISDQRTRHIEMLVESQKPNDHLTRFTQDKFTKDGKRIDNPRPPTVATEPKTIWPTNLPLPTSTNANGRSSEETAMNGSHHSPSSLAPMQSKMPPLMTLNPFPFEPPQPVSSISFVNGSALVSPYMYYPPIPMPMLHVHHYLQPPFMLPPPQPQFAYAPPPGFMSFMTNLPQPPPLVCPMPSTVEITEITTESSNEAGGIDGSFQSNLSVHVKEFVPESTAAESDNDAALAEWLERMSLDRSNESDVVGSAPNVVKNSLDTGVKKVPLAKPVVTAAVSESAGPSVDLFNPAVIQRSSVTGSNAVLSPPNGSSNGPSVARSPQYFYGLATTAASDRQKFPPDDITTMETPFTWQYPDNVGSLAELEWAVKGNQDVLTLSIGQIYSFDEFYVQLDGYIYALIDLTMLMKRFFGDAELSAKYTIPKGTDVLHLVVATMLEGEWYRAIVMSVDHLVTNVVFVDAGTKRQVPLQDIRYLPRRFMDLPFQAIRCRLCGIQPNVGQKDFSNNAVARFAELSQEYQLRGCVRWTEGNFLPTRTSELPTGILSLYLCDVRSEVDVYIHKKLIEERYGRLKNEELNIEFCIDKGLKTQQEFERESKSVFAVKFPPPRPVVVSMSPPSVVPPVAVPLPKAQAVGRPLTPPPGFQRIDHAATPRQPGRFGPQLSNLSPQKSPQRFTSTNIPKVTNTTASVQPSRVSLPAAVDASKVRQRFSATNEPKVTNNAAFREPNRVSMPVATGATSSKAPGSNEGFGGTQQKVATRENQPSTAAKKIDSLMERAKNGNLDDDGFLELITLLNDKLQKALRQQSMNREASLEGVYRETIEATRGKLTWVKQAYAVQLARFPL